VAVTFMAFGSIALLTGVIFQMQMPTFRSHLRVAYQARGIIPADKQQTGDGP
jgi:hypothetical protein